MISEESFFQTCPIIKFCRRVHIKREGILFRLDIECRTNDTALLAHYKCTYNSWFSASVQKCCSTPQTILSPITRAAISRLQIYRRCWSAIVCVIFRWYDHVYFSQWLDRLTEISKPETELQIAFERAGAISYFLQSHFHFYSGKIKWKKKYVKNTSITQSVNQSDRQIMSQSISG